jgi:hypothetical protein
MTNESGETNQAYDAERRIKFRQLQQLVREKYAQELNNELKAEQHREYTRYAQRGFWRP